MGVLKHKAWTIYYNPMTMGGSCERPILAEVTCTGPYDLGKGYTGYIAISPLTGDNYIVESETGAFVGESLDQVKYDIEVAGDAVMRNQIAEAKKIVLKAEHITAELFWQRMLKSR